jgi:hypothetical protein
MKFEIQDLKFEIVRAELVAFVDDEFSELVWGVEIETKPQHLLDIKSECKPRATCDRIISTKKGKLKSWRDIIGREASWRAAGAGGDARALLYFFSHIPIYNSSIKLVASPSRNGVGLVWVGQADLHFGKNYDKGIKFRIESDYLPPKNSLW